MADEIKEEAGQKRSVADTGASSDSPLDMAPPKAEEGPKDAADKDAPAEAGEAPSSDGKAKPARRRRPIRTCFKLLAGLLVGLLVLVALALALVWQALQHQTCQDYLRAKANEVLHVQGLELTKLTGSIPFDMRTGLKMKDAHGVWVEIPDLAVTMHLAEFSKEVGVSLSVLDGVLYRAPDLPPSEAAPAPAPGEPLSLRLLRQKLAELAKATEAVPDYVPAVKIEKLEVRRFRVLSPVYLGTSPQAQSAAPQESSGTSPAHDAGAGPAPAAATPAHAVAEGKAAESPAQDAPAKASAIPAGKASASASADRLAAGIELNLAGQAAVTPASLAGGQDSQGSQGGKFNWKDPAIEAHFALDLNPLARQAAGGDVAPAESALELMPHVKLGRSGLTLDLAGTLSHPELALGVRSAELGVPGQNVKDLAFSLGVPASLIDDLAQGREGAVDLGLKLALNKAPIDLKLAVGGSLSDEAPALFVRNLAARALGIAIDGGITAVFPPDVLEKAMALSNKAAKEAKSDAPAEPLKAEAKPAKADVGGQPADVASGMPVAQPAPLAATPAPPAPDKGKGKGTVGALIPDDLAGLIPRLTGGLAVDVQTWDAVALAAPGISVSGSPLKVQLGLSHEGAQDLSLAVDAPKLGVKPDPKTLFDIAGFSVKADVKDVLGEPDALLKLGLGAFAGAGVKVANAKVEASGGMAKGVDFAVSAGGDVDADLAGHFKPGELSMARLNATYRQLSLGVRSQGPVHVAYGPGMVDVRGLSIDILPKGHLDLQAKMDNGALNAQGRLSRVEMAAYRKLVPALPEGGIEADFSLKGPLEAPEGGLNLKVSKLKVPEVPFGPMDFVLKALIGRDGAGQRVLANLEIPKSTLALFGGKESTIQVRVPLKSQGQGQPPLPDETGRLDGKVQYRGTLDKLWALADQADRRLAGRLGLDAQIAGSMEDPKVSGKVTLDSCTFSDVATGLEVRDIKLAATLANTAKELLDNKVAFDFSCTDGRSGRVAFKGSSDLQGKSLDVKGTIRDFAPLRRQDLKAVLSGELAVAGPATSPRVTGNVRVDKGQFDLEQLSVVGGVDELPLEEGPKDRLVANLGKQKASEAEAKKAQAAKGGASASGPGSLDIHFTMPPRFFVYGYGLDTSWRADLRIRGPLTQPGITGEVRSERGKLDFLNRKFTMAKGQVLFNGGLDPLLDIQLKNEVADIEAFVNVQGTPDKIDFSLTSNPDMPQEEIIARILFGKSSSELTQFELLQLGATVARMAAFQKTGGGMTAMAKKTVGLDVLNVNQAEGGGATLEMGKYLTDKLYVGVEKATGEKAQTSAIIQLELGPRTSATVKTGGSNTSVGFKWKYDY
ncbi:MAG: translocation/assembly module TamB [Desulfovibrio sp.]|nr:translocation/assembly module TamB [Desulfovibrio sp.]